MTTTYQLHYQETETGSYLNIISQEHSSQANSALFAPSRALNHIEATDFLKAILDLHPDAVKTAKKPINTQNAAETNFLKTILALDPDIATIAKEPIDLQDALQIERINKKFNTSLSSIKLDNNGAVFYYLTVTCAIQQLHQYYLNSSLSEPVSDQENIDFNIKMLSALKKIDPHLTEKGGEESRPQTLRVSNYELEFSPTMIKTCIQDIENKVHQYYLEIWLNILDPSTRITSSERAAAESPSTVISLNEQEKQFRYLLSRRNRIDQDEDEDDASTPNTASTSTVAPNLNAAIDDQPSAESYHAQQIKLQLIKFHSMKNWEELKNRIEDANEKVAVLKESLKALLEQCKFLATAEGRHHEDLDQSGNKKYISVAADYTVILQKLNTERSHFAFHEIVTIQEHVNGWQLHFNQFIFEAYVKKFLSLFKELKLKLIEVSKNSDYLNPNHKEFFDSCQDYLPNAKDLQRLITSQDLNPTTELDKIKRWAEELSHDIPALEICRAQADTNIKLAKIEELKKTIASLIEKNEIFKAIEEVNQKNNRFTLQHQDHYAQYDAALAYFNNILSQLNSEVVDIDIESALSTANDWMVTFDNSIFKAWFNLNDCYITLVQKITRKVGELGVDELQVYRTDETSDFLWGKIGNSGILDSLSSYQVIAAEGMSQAQQHLQGDKTIALPDSNSTTTLASRVNAANFWIRGLDEHINKTDLIKKEIETFQDHIAKRSGLEKQVSNLTLNIMSFSLPQNLGANLRDEKKAELELLRQKAMQELTEPKNLDSEIKQANVDDLETYLKKRHEVLSKSKYNTTTRRDVELKLQTYITDITAKIEAQEKYIQAYSQETKEASANIREQRSNEIDSTRKMVEQLSELMSSEQDADCELAPTSASLLQQLKGDVDDITKELSAQIPEQLLEENGMAARLAEIQNSLSTAQREFEKTIQNKIATKSTRSLIDGAVNIVIAEIIAEAHQFKQKISANLTRLTSFVRDELPHYELSPLLGFNNEIIDLNKKIAEHESLLELVDNLKTCIDYLNNRLTDNASLLVDSKEVTEEIINKANQLMEILVQHEQLRQVQIVEKDQYAKLKLLYPSLEKIVYKLDENRQLDTLDKNTLQTFFKMYQAIIPLIATVPLDANSAQANKPSDCFDAHTGKPISPSDWIKTAIEKIHKLPLTAGMLFSYEEWANLSAFHPLLQTYFLPLTQLDELINKLKDMSVAESYQGSISTNSSVFFEPRVAQIINPHFMRLCNLINGFRIQPLLSIHDIQNYITEISAIRKEAQEKETQLNSDESPLRLSEKRTPGQRDAIKQIFETIAKLDSVLESMEKVFVIITYHSLIQPLYSRLQQNSEGSKKPEWCNTLLSKISLFYSRENFKIEHTNECVNTIQSFIREMKKIEPAYDENMAEIFKIIRPLLKIQLIAKDKPAELVESGASMSRAP